MGTLSVSKLLITLIELLSIATAKRKSDTSDTVKPGSAASHHLPIETHHSLHHPFDVSMPYWKYGGSTVCTESFIRLTPNSQSRQGWMFNEFELQSSDWEIELHFTVRSDYHIGGDGFGIFILNDTFHPRRNKGHNYLAGSIFGLTEKFQGFGLVFDTYDNDNNRDNPAIYVLKQERDKMQQWNNDNDYADNMVKETSKKDNAFQCTNNYRNADNHRVILRYIGGELHVYVKSLSSEEYEYCLSVYLGIDTKKYYIALAAMTGQVADKHDIYLLSTRYLDSNDAQKIDDARLRKAGYRGRRISWKSVLFWLLIFFLNIFLIYEVIYEYWEFSKLQSEQLNPVILCQRLNGHIYVAYVVHAAVVVLVILAGRWSYFLVNLPFIGWRAYQYMVNNIKLEAVKIRKLRNVLDVGQPIGSMIKLAILIVSFIGWRAYQ
eukprot:CAMPEP_0197048684 /NCGR_PEP_ID=MMETSP1384-20130603/23984_1 /TAXON_ID=29189 /ORGANISM="Ammonia sp." /LENGTH=433 /DNA_ID=CAMNT_0042480849 /DNA_START=10 /DNA_END=1308 /DNA_ORIENTATION=-